MALAPICERGGLRLLFKGGNVVAFVRASAARMLRRASRDARVAALADELQGGGALSDVDFYALLDVALALSAVCVSWQRVARDISAAQSLTAHAATQPSEMVEVAPPPEPEPGKV